MRKRYPHKPNLSVVSSQSNPGLVWTTPSNSPKSSEPDAQEQRPGLSLPFDKLPRKPIVQSEQTIYSDDVDTQSEEDSFSLPNSEAMAKTPPSRYRQPNLGSGKPSFEMGQQPIASNPRERRRRSPSPHLPTKNPQEPPPSRRGSLQMPKAVKPLGKAPVSQSVPLTQPQQVAKSNPKPRKRLRRRRPHPLVYGIRMIVLGVGLGAIAGTLLSIWDPANHTADLPQAETASQIVEQRIEAQTKLINAVQLNNEIAPLKETVKSLASQSPDLTPGVFVVDLDTGAYIDINAASSFSAASTIKLPVIVAFFQDVDAGKISLDEILTMRQENIAEGSGDMQDQPPGTKYTALETVTKMIEISDNTATNMLIERLGGAESLNQRFQEWGLQKTQIRNPLPDLTGTNTTSPKDLANIMGLLHQGKLVSPPSRDRILAIMRQTVNNSLLPQGLGEGATIAHKTGDIGSLVGDVGLIDLPTGKRYIAAAMVKRPFNDDRASELIRQISSATYKYLYKPPTTAASPEITVTPKMPADSLDPPANGNQQARMEQ